VEVQQVKSMQDVQRFYLTLEPQQQQHLEVEDEAAAAAKESAAGAVDTAGRGGKSGSSSGSGKVRLVVVPKKRLPDIKRHERFFAFVGE
jgi:hypothetical protein